MLEMSRRKDVEKTFADIVSEAESNPDYILAAFAVLVALMVAAFFVWW